MTEATIHFKLSQFKQYAKFSTHLTTQRKHQNSIELVRKHQGYSCPCKQHAHTAVFSVTAVKQLHQYIQSLLVPRTMASNASKKKASEFLKFCSSFVDYTLKQGS